MDHPAHTHTYSLPGLIYTPVELGTIRIGSLQETDGKMLPVKDDAFRVTYVVKDREGNWIDHPLQAKLLAAQAERARQAQKGNEGSAPPSPSVERKLREIPIRFQFDDPDLVFRAQLQAFDTRSKRMVCASIGPGKAKRLSAEGPVEVECPGPDHCGFARDGVRCKTLGRLQVQIEGQEDPENTFVARTTSINSIRNLESKIVRYWAKFGRQLTGVPFKLVLRTRTTASSFWQPFYFFDLTLNGVTEEKAKQLADEHAQAVEDSDIDTDHWTSVVRAGLNNGLLSADPEEAELVEEFYAEGEGGSEGSGVGVSSGPAQGAAPAKLPTLSLPARRREPPPPQTD